MRKLKYANSSSSRSSEQVGDEVTVEVRRRRNPRGQGQRLRDEIIEAASELLAETGDVRRLSLRAVARRVGIAAPSVYPHFRDLDELAVAVTDRLFPELEAAIGAAVRGVRDPLPALLAGCRAYCRYALEHPGHYRVLFDADLGRRTQTEAGRRVFQRLTDGVRACLALRAGAGGETGGDTAAFVAGLIWSALHGLVMLRLSRSEFPWAPLDRMVEETVRRLVDVDLEPDAAAPRRGRPIGGAVPGPRDTGVRSDGAGAGSDGMEPGEGER
jgi:AcrR family transcriptional regulator